MLDSQLADREPGDAAASHSARNTSATLIHRVIEAQVARTPDATAVIHDDRRWTYAELDRAANVIADGLRARIDCHGALIGVSIGRSREMLACLLGVLKTGAAYLPLDPDLPGSRLDQIVADAGPRLVIGSASALAAISDTVGKVSLDDLADGPPRAATTVSRRSLPSSEDRIAYVMYTSGSTGRPKGVEVRHAAVLNMLASTQREPGLGADDVLLAATRMSFDVSVLDFFLPLSCGACMVVAGQDVASDPTRLADLIERSRATVMQATPATWRALVDTGWPGSASLRIWCGGEALTRALADRLLPRCLELWNMYGPTETTVWSTVGRVEPGLAIALGHPIDRTTLLVVDEHLAPVANRVAGELCIGGAGLARGYRGRDDLTAERFVVLPAVGERYYRTGDLVRYDAAGDLHYLGRIDSQVKIRGHRVEMGEVEAVIEHCPGVAACAVRCWPDAIGETALFAYIVGRAGTDGLVAAVQTHVRGLLPEYMVPQRIFVLDALPLSPSRKVDRNALPPPSAMADEARDGGRSLTPVEVTLAAIWSDLLGIGHIAAADDFFDLGGYSLLTVHLVCRIEETFDRRLSMADLLEKSTLAAMAAMITDTAASDSDRLIPLQASGSRPPLYWLDAGPLLRSMARAVGDDQPILGLNLSPAAEAGLVASGFDIPHLAALVVERLRQAAPDGPYYLGGWCRWGVVTYEVACQLRARGSEVRLVVLLDADNPAWRPPGIVRSAARWARRTVRQWRQPPPASFSQMVEASVAGYRPGRFDGNVALLRPAENESGTPADGGWTRVVGGRVACYVTPGSHVSMVRPPASTALGRAVATALARAQADAF